MIRIYSVELQSVGPEFLVGMGCGVQETDSLSELIFLHIAGGGRTEY